MAATTTIEVSKADREAARAVAARGGPFNPAEYAMLETLEPAERSALKFRVVGRSIDRDEAVTRGAVEAKFAERRAKAEADLEAARAATSKAWADRDRADAELRRVQSATWVSSSGSMDHYERGGTAAEIEAAKAQFEEAESRLKTAQDDEGKALVNLNGIGRNQFCEKRRIT